MTRLVARLVLAMLLLPLSGALVSLAIAIFMRRPAPPSPIEVSGMWAFVYVFIGVYWILLWREIVRWTRERKRKTLLAALLAILCGVALEFALSIGLVAGPRFAGSMAGGGVVPILWVLATVLIWRESPKERAERLARGGVDAVSCPVCGYNMTGLKEARCPECGAQFTLDQLLAAQPQREVTGLTDD